MPLFLGLEKIAAPWTDYLVVMNSFDAEMAARHRIAPPDRLLSIPGIGVDRSSYYGPAAVPEFARTAIRRELGLQDGEPSSSWSAEFIPRKRHADAIAAMAHLPDTPAYLLLAGDGPLLEKMKALAVSLRVAGRVHFIGLRNDVPRLLRAADVALLPSQQEGLPRAILEAMAMGVPAIGSDIRGTRELLASGAGRLFPTGNVGRRSPMPCDT